MHSPLSQIPPQKVRDLSREFILAKLADYFHASPAADMVETNYAIWRCEETGLEFCDPPLAGNVAFYEWISSFSSYYPGFRWEYGKVMEILKNKAASRPDFKVLDVGCGKGDFLRSLKFLPVKQRYALDLNESAIRACRDQGFPAFRGTVETAITSGFLKPSEFSVVTSFHCLEHVEQPVEFVRELLRALAPGGSLFLSTPYSPMSFEDGWFDIMNHPPHHMTRWTLSAYRQLAKILGVSMRHFAPHNRTVSLKQALQLFRLKKYGPNVTITRSQRAKDMICHFPQLLSNWRNMSRRAKAHDNAGADLILIEFKLP